MILMYHKIHPDTPTMWWVSVNNFYRQMVEISDKKIVYLDDYDPFDKNQVVITFDGVYKNVYEFALPILKYFNYPFELFITSNYIGNDNSFDYIEPAADFTTIPELIELISGGGRLQWHTKSHPNLKNEDNIIVINEELTIPENILKIDQNGFNWFAYPYGEFNDVVLKEVKGKFRGAISCNQGDDFNKFFLNRLTVENKTRLTDKTISCIIPCFNYADFLIEAIESVLRQTLLPNEILISDDCSTDETRLIAEEYVRKYPKLIRYNRNDTNLGIVKHFNKAVGLVCSDFIFFLGADNRILSNYVEESFKTLNSSNKIAIAYTDYAFFGPRAKLAYEELPDFRKNGVINETFYKIIFPEISSRYELLDLLKKSNIIHGSSMFRRIAFSEVKGYKESNLPEDYNLFKTIVEAGWEAKKVNKTNLEYRQHSSLQANNIFTLQNKMLFYKNSFLDIKNRKSNFEKSKYYKISLKLYNFINFMKKNYNKPIKIFQKIASKIK